MIPHQQSISDQPPLSDEGRNILAVLVREMGRGRFRPHDEGTFCGYKELHGTLGLPQKGPQWGKSLENQGLAELAKWIRAMELPAVTGLIVGEEVPRLPGKGYYEVNGIPIGSTDWWRDQIRKSIAFDWSPWVPDGEHVSFADFSLEARFYREGVASLVTREVKSRCDALRNRVRELFRSPDGFLCCKICDWHKPDHRISGDIVELHHLELIYESPGEGRIVTIAEAVDLFVPICPTCHRMIHSRTGGGQFAPDTLRAILQKNPPNK